MKYINEYGVIITVIEIDKLGQLTYKIENNNKVDYRCVLAKDFYSMIDYNNYKEVK